MPVYSKTQEEKQRILKVVKKIFLMKSLQEDQVSTIINALQFRNYKAGDDLIVQGEEGSEYFLLLEGEVTVFGYFSDEMLLPVQQRAIAFQKDMPSGVGFGELALMYNDKRSANVVAKTHVKTAVLDGDVFKKIVISMAMKSRKQNMEFLDSVQLFNRLDRYEKAKLIDGLEIVNMKKDEFVIHEGEAGDKFYIIEKGQV